MCVNVMHPNRYMRKGIWDMSTSIWDTKLQTGGVEDWVICYLMRICVINHDTVKWWWNLGHSSVHC
jgi:hypothetical protein